MTNVETTDEEAMNKVLPMLKVLQGGKGGPTSGGINWLNGLKKGTAFSCKMRGKTDLLNVYIVAFKYDRTVVLVDGFDSNLRFAVDPEEFCKKYNWWETIGTEEEAVEQPKEIEDGRSDRTVQSGPVEDDAGPEA